MDPIEPKPQKKTKPAKKTRRKKTKLQKSIRTRSDRLVYQMRRIPGTRRLLSDILLEPSRIYNADESGFNTCPKTGKVLGPRGLQNMYDVKSGNEKECITVMANFNASGDVVPPMIVFALKKISREISQNMNETWFIGKAEKGWMNGPLYHDYIKHSFLPWLKEHNIKMPILLLVDGHKSHCT